MLNKTLTPMDQRAYQPRVRLPYELVLSLYLSLLAVWTNAQTASSPWVVRLQRLLAPQSAPHSFLDLNLRWSIGLLWLSSAILVFIFLRLAAKFTRAHDSLLALAGLMTVAGFPLAYTYARRGTVWGLGALVAIIGIAAAVVYLIVRRRPATLWIAVIALLYFGFCSLGALTAGQSRLLLLWPGYDWLPFTKRHPDLIYPILGFCSTLLWATYVKSSSIFLRNSETGCGT